VLDIHVQHQRHFSYWSDCGHLWIRLSNDRYLQCNLIQAPYYYRETEVEREWTQLPRKSIPMLAIQHQKGQWKGTQTSSIIDHRPIPVAATFLQYVATLPPWEAEILHYVELEADAYTVSEALSHGIRAVSDGSDWHQIQGSFGWAMSNDIGERCGYGMGPARSSSPHAYRSESYGLLSLLCFLHCLAEFTGYNEQWHGIVATDSQSLINTVMDTSKHLSPEESSGAEETPFIHRKVKKYLLDPMLPEWDIIRGIQMLLMSMPDIALQHVKGHQDDNTQYHRLPLLAQLNVDADKQATCFQILHGGFQPEVLHTAWSGVHLILPNGTITSHVNTALRFQATGPPLKAYMAHRYDWTPQIMATVNWKAHGTSLRKQLSKKTHLVKFVHGILPTNSKLHRTDPIRSKCPRCMATKETWQHIWRCRHAVREEWRSQLLIEVTKRCHQLRTMPSLQKLLLQAISKWLVDKPKFDTPFQMAVEGYTPAVSRIILQQNAIGWDHIFQGRFSASWSDLQDTYYAHQACTADIESKKGLSGNYWQVAIIGVLWTQWFQLWEIRNHDLHGADKRELARAERTEVERNLREIYDIKSQLEPSVQQLLCQHITAHFSKPVWYNKNWIAIHAPLVTTSLKRAKARALQGVRSIRSYFIQG
jgi:hypothetical protein